MELILSVTVAKVWPGAMMAGPRLCTVGCRSSLMLRLNLRIRVAQRGQIGGARARVQFRQQRVIQGFGFQLRDAALGIVDIPEDDGLGRADLLAGGPDLAIAHRAAFALGVD